MTKKSLKTLSKTKKFYTISYDNDCVGEHWSITDKVFESEKDAERYIREYLVNEKTGIACFYEDFTVHELELTGYYKMSKEKNNPNMKEQFKKEYGNL